MAETAMDPGLQQYGAASGGAPLRLMGSRKDAMRELQAAIKIGQAIRGQRIREMRDLEEARREKQEWLQRTLETLGTLVNTEAWAEQFNDYIAKILPEFAEFEMFVDVFEEEMKHRLGRLQSFLKSIPEVPEPGSLQEAAAEARAAYSEIAPEPDPEPQPEMLYVPPETTMPQQQQQQQQQRMSQQTVAASILIDPPPLASQPRATALPSATVGSTAPAISQGALVVRTNDEPAAQGIAQFLHQMNLSLRVIDRRNPAAAVPLINELGNQSGARFVLMLVDATLGDASPDDCFDLGCCVGRMGADRVITLHRGGDGTVDRFGIAHVPLDGTEGWQLHLARLLRKAGANVDLNKLM